MSDLAHFAAVFAVPLLLFQLPVYGISRPSALPLQRSRQSEVQYVGIAAEADVLPKVVYATFMSSKEQYLDQAEAQISTWAKQARSQGRYFAIGDSHLSYKNPATFRPVDCGSDRQDVACKMGYLFIEGARRNADWIVVVQTDMYVNTTGYEALLARIDSSQPIAVAGAMGCGCSKDGIPDTVTIHRAFKPGCNEVLEQGGICGSRIYAISRAAVRKMIGGDDGGFVQKMKAFADNSVPEDMANSCALRQAGVPIYMFNETHAGGFIDAMADMAIMKKRLSLGIYMMHQVTTNGNLWIQAVVDGNAEEQARIEREMTVNGKCLECVQGIHQAWASMTRVSKLGNEPEGTEAHVCG